MIVRGLSLTLAILFAGTMLAETADAGERRRLRRDAERYYGPPEVFVGVPGFRLLFGDYALSPEEFDALYGRESQEFDESYYEPEPVAPKPRKKPLAKPAKKPAEPSATSSKSAAQPNETQTTAAIAPRTAAGAKLAAKPASKPAATPAASAGLSCDKASAVVAGYGFTGVTASSCKGKLYAFNATRDGKDFAIKLDPASGELTEVKKLP